MNSVTLLDDRITELRTMLQGLIEALEERLDERFDELRDHVVEVEEKVDGLEKPFAPGSDDGSD